MTLVSIILMASTADYTVEVRREGLRKREWSPTSSTSYSTNEKYLSPSGEMYDGLSRLTSLLPHHKDFFSTVAVVPRGRLHLQPFVPHENRVVFER